MTEKDAKRRFSRRAALKALLGAGVGGALITLPNSWTKPVIDVGVLPAHAQLSAACTTITRGAQASAIGSCNGTTPDGTTIDLSFDFTSTVGVVAVDSWARLPGTEWNSTIPPSVPQIRSGDANGGQIAGNICVDVTNNPGVEIVVEMTQSDGATCEEVFTGPFPP
jgi:hypothetical protein